MAASVTLSAGLCSPVSSAAVSGARVASKASPKAVARMASFAGLKPMAASGSVLSSPVSVEEKFAQVAASIRATRRGARAGGGGALAATNDVGAEIFRIIPIMCGMTLLGIAVGFVILRVETALEESE
ncbi:hypothetical protein CBR_g48936 [Chara braunii]|uniref:Cytochrome b6-f complex subunit 7 n=1 Tax=Chara braunii TaxID=69332 RepID=A0A388M3Q9_CHABU|nr:hypothetical protein CBR_g48936 [Chara braunii]|eukprot:GBG89228.1 hypothetical protein CBR_g48936 [Chara braunii]